MDSIRRIRSMALVHEKLYRSENLSQIDFGEYLKSIAEEVRRSIGNEGVSLRVDVEQIMLGVDVAVPCGLIVNELISNAFKHAFPGGQAGTVITSFRRLTGTTLELKVEDNGIGFPAESEIFKMPSLGMSIVTSLAEQIQGTIAVTREHGTTIAIVFDG
jgi:two-component sensor histidine kinase